MAKQVFTNNASSVLTTGVTAVETTLVLSDASKFPSPTAGDYFLMALIGLNVNGQEASWEIVKCTDRTTNTLTVVRAQEGTTAAAWGVATRVEVRVTAEFVNAVALHLSSLESPQLTPVTVSGTTVTAVTGSIYILTNVAATTVTLPVSPASGDTVAVCPDNTLATNVIARNGQTIMGVAENMTLDNATITVTLRFLNNTWRLV